MCFETNGLSFFLWFQVSPVTSLSMDNVGTEGMIEVE